MIFEKEQKLGGSIKGRSSITASQQYVLSSIASPQYTFKLVKARYLIAFCIGRSPFCRCTLQKAQAMPKLWPKCRYLYVPTVLLPIMFVGLHESAQIQSFSFS
jgi:hypothetical protein